MKSAFFLFYLLLLGINAVHGQDLIITDISELEDRQEAENRPVLVFLTADWCTYCKRVEQTSFKNEALVRELNSYFYTVLFDIESKRTISWLGTSYRYQPTGVNTGVHTLAEYLGTIKGVLNTPTFIMMDTGLQVIYRYGGFMDTEQISAMLMQTKAYMENTSGN